MTTTTTEPFGACTITYTYDDSGYLLSKCVDCPEIPAVAAVPAQTITDPQLGWNAAARSAIARAGACFTQFSVPAHVRGVVCGLAPALKSTRPRDVPHGFYVYQDAGSELWRVLEGGVAKTAPVKRDPATDVFRIERRHEVVRYFFNGRQLYVSETPSAGELVVVACLYAAGDGVN